MQRPWAQVIQFGLALHSAPEPIIRAMLARPDDAFCTGLRLVGRCIANGATVSAELREEIGNHLIEYWVHAPSRSRERVGRLLTDGFSNPPSGTLIAALHHRWLINDGAGDIISKLNYSDLTLSVLKSLIECDRSSIMIYHSLKPALRAAGDAALRVVMDNMDPDTLEKDDLIAISSFFLNFSKGANSRELALSIARNRRLPAQARMRAYALAATPLEEDGVALALTAFRHNDWDRHYEAADLVKAHAEPLRFLGELLRDASIPVMRRRELAADVTSILPDAATRRAFSQECISDSSVDEEIRLTLQLLEVRFGDRAGFENLVEGISQIPINFAATTIALFGHFPDRVLAERAARFIRNRKLSTEEIVRISNSVSTGMLHIFEMDFGFGGTLRPAPPHPGLAAWTELLEDWAGHQDLTSGASSSTGSPRRNDSRVRAWLRTGEGEAGSSGFCELGFAALPRRLDEERPELARTFNLAPRRFPTRCGLTCRRAGESGRGRRVGTRAQSCAARGTATKTTPLFALDRENCCAQDAPARFATPMRTCARARSPKRCSAPRVLAAHPWGAAHALVFDSRLTTYAGLARLDAMGVSFITLRRRSPKILTEIRSPPRRGDVSASMCPRESTEPPACGRRRSRSQAAVCASSTSSTSVTTSPPLTNDARPRLSSPDMPSACFRHLAMKVDMRASSPAACIAASTLARIRRVIDLHEEKLDWLLRDTIANAIELMAARQGVVIQKVDGRYQLAS